MSAPRPLILIAASGLAREVISVVERRPDIVVRGLLDDEPSLRGTLINGVPVLGGIDAVVHHPDARLLICAGRGQVRALIRHRLARLGVTDERFATVVADSVRVPSSCSVGAGSILLEQVVLTSDVSVGQHVVLMPHVTLTHDNQVDAYATLCAGVRLGGTVRIGRAAYLGMNSCVREFRTVGEGAVLGMGAVLLSDLPAGETWMGVPARPRSRTGTIADTTGARVVPSAGLAGPLRSHVALGLPHNFEIEGSA